MGRRGQRIPLEAGISTDGTGYSVRAKVGTTARELRFPHTVDLPYLRAQRAQLEADIRQAQQEAEPTAPRGTFAGDVKAYLKRMKGRIEKATYRSRDSELKAWVTEFKTRSRHQLRRVDVVRAIGKWRRGKYPSSPKTIQNRVRTLKHLYVELDGKRARTPADDVKLPKPIKVRPRIVTKQTVRKVIATLIHQERNGRLRDAKTRARFLVRITSGQRPVQIMETTARDIDLEQRIWLVPPAKGGEPVPLYLNDDMWLAWTLYVKAKAWGKFDTTSQARVLRRAGWPVDVPIYNARHTVGIGFSESGEDLADIQAWMGHRHIQTTRDFYVPMLFSRMKAMSQRANTTIGLASGGARFGGTTRRRRKRSMKARVKTA